VPPSFENRRVLTLESRRAAEIATLVTTFGGRPLSAPALREVPLASNTEALAFAAALTGGNFDIVVLLTGVGLRTLLAVVDAAGDRATFVAALGRTRIAARGPKPVGVLRELGLSPWVTAPEPNTWRELVAALDAKGEAMHGRRVAIQEYGRSNRSLIDALSARGAQVTPVPVYQYDLPEDLAPLQRAVTAVVDGEVDVALFTTGTQVAHLFRVAETMGREAALREALARVVIASIGPTTSEEVREHGLAVDFEPSHPKMGLLVREAAEQSNQLAARRRRIP
jgi:uroporphyrinogen-III synthase